MSSKDKKESVAISACNISDNFKILPKKTRAKLILAAMELRDFQNKNKAFSENTGEPPFSGEKK